MKIIFLCLLATVAVCSATPWHQLKATGYNFESFVKEFNKVYSESEYEMRKQVFDANLAEIHRHNDEGLHTFKKGVNHFTAHTQAEFRSLLGYRKDLKQNTDFSGMKLPDYIYQMKVEDLPTHVDWREQGAVTAVKDQGQCGSCWTFASTESIESANYLATGQLQVLSEQQIASCSSNPKHCGGTGGCEGGTAEIAFQGVMDVGGIRSEWQYPYVSYGGQDQECNTNLTWPFTVKLKTYVQLPGNELTPLMAAVATVGPIAISVDASAWSSYETGVFSGCNNTNPDIDHAVLLVGYGTDSSLGDYWLVRNSWSPAWGEKGYIRIPRQDPNSFSCGEDLSPADGVACEPYPKTQKACGTCGILIDSSYPVIAN